MDEFSRDDRGNLGSSKLPLILFVASDLADTWRELGEALAMKPSVLDAVEYECGPDARECLRESLCRWQRSLADSEGAVCQFEIALTKLKRQDLVDDLQSMTGWYCTRCMVLLTIIPINVVVIAGSEDALLHYQLSLRSYYQNNVLKDSVFFDSHFGFKLALLKPEVRQKFDSFYYSTIDMLKEKICCHKELFTFQNLFKFSDESQRCVILLLGGVYGKTHLCMSVLREWASLSMHSQFKFVFYIPVELYVYTTFQDEAELLQMCFAECAPNPEVLKEIVSSRGAECLFIIDGIDKAPFQVFQRSLLFKIIEGSCFENAAIVMTARPLLLESLQSFASRAVEVLPLSVESVPEICFSLAGSGIQGSMVKRLLSNNPLMASYCTTPAVLTYIYRIFKHVKSLELTLTANLVNWFSTRDLANALTPEFRFQAMPMKFQKLCLLAVKGIVRGQTCFNESELEALGISQDQLPDSSPLIAVSVVGEGRSIYFPCRVAQLFLAACHMASLGNEAQVDMFVKHVKDPSLFFLWLLFAGLSKLANKALITVFVKFYVEQRNLFGRARFQLLLMSMFEAQSSQVCQEVGSLLKLDPGTTLTASLDPADLELEQKLIGSVVQLDKLSNADLVTIAYFVCNSCNKTRLLLLDSDITSAKLKMLLNAFQKFANDDSSGLQELQ